MVTKAVPAPAKETAGIKLASAAEGAATAKPEALEPCTDDEAGHGPDMAPRDGLTASERACDMVPRHGSTDGERALEARLQEAATVEGREDGLKPLRQGALAEREYERALPTRGNPAAHRPDWPSREGATRRTWPMRETPPEGASTALEAREARGTCQPNKPPWDAVHELRRPFGARKASPSGVVECPTSQTWPYKTQISRVAWTTATATYLRPSCCRPRMLSREAILKANLRVLRPSERPSCGRRQRRPHSSTS